MSSPVGTPPNPQWEMEPSDEVKASEDVVSSNEHSQPESGGGPSRAKKRVGFGGRQDSEEGDVQVSWIDPLADSSSSQQPASGYNSPPNSEESTPRNSRSGSGDLQLPRNISKSHLPDLTPQQTREIHEAFDQHPLGTRRPRPAMRRAESVPAAAEKDSDGPDPSGQRTHRERRMREAFERGKRLEHDEISASNSRYNSPERHRRDSDANEDDDESDENDMPTLRRSRALFEREARQLVRKHTRRRAFHDETPSAGFRSGAATPTEEQNYAHDYRPRPEQYRGGVLGMILNLYNHDDDSASHSRSSSLARLIPRVPHSRENSETPTPQQSPSGSGTATPRVGRSVRKWFSRTQRHHSAPSIAQLVGTSASLGSPAVAGVGEKGSTRLREHTEQEGRPGLGRKSHSSSALAAFNRVTGHQRRLEEEIRITIHIAETIARQRYLMRLCKALMQYGAPTHRLEEYMRMSARVLEIEAQFLYIPGSMIMSFDDAETHTTEVKLVRVSQGLDLGKLRDVHEVYKEVVHDRIGVEEATQRLKKINSRKDKHSRWLRIPVYGLAAVFVGPFAFEARLIDLPIAFLLGCGLGVLQLVVAPASDLYANVFEISAAVITSFLSRAFGSIPYKDGRLFCFSALAQSSIALILPGYIVLTASLELQSKSIVAGSVRMVYAIIYSLFLGYGITIGSAIWGLMYDNATSETTCSNPLPSHWNFLFVPGFAICLTVINQAKWKQTPVMVFIALVGYIVNFYSAKRFSGNTQVSNTLGALAIGVMANLYSRIGSQMENWTLDRWEDDIRPRWRKFRKQIFRHSTKESPKKLEAGVAGDDESALVRSTRRVGYGLAAAAMLPAIFVQVPSGLAVSGSLVSGIASANQITGNGTNGTNTLSSATSLTSGTSNGLNTVAFNVSYSVIQIAIGITVGLFLSAIVVYPFGKKRSGLFSL